MMALAKQFVADSAELVVVSTVSILHLRAKRLQHSNDSCMKRARAPNTSHIICPAVDEIRLVGGELGLKRRAKSLRGSVRVDNVIIVSQDLPYLRFESVERGLLHHAVCDH
jgi:hypothetical protein